MAASASCLLKAARSVLNNPVLVLAGVCVKIELTFDTFGKVLSSSLTGAVDNVSCENRETWVLQSPGFFALAFRTGLDIELWVMVEGFSTAAAGLLVVIGYFACSS